MFTQVVPLGRVLARKMLVSTDDATVRGLWEHLHLEHIHFLEPRAIHLGVRALLPFIQGKHVLVRTTVRPTITSITRGAQDLGVASRLPRDSSFGHSHTWPH